MPIVRLGLCVSFQGHDPDWIGRNIYSLPISQLDAFATGAALVVFKMENMKAPLKWLLWCSTLVVMCGASLLVYQHLMYHNAFKWSFGYPMYLMPGYGFVWGYSLLNVFSALLIISALQTNVVAKALQFPPLAWIGKISYGVYVYHLPIIVALAHATLSKWSLSAVCLIITIIVSELSFRILEIPFLKLKESPPAQLPAHADVPQKSVRATKSLSADII
jgi:peptidoglycan/LPS O-acetylase OafA/YrhL